MSDPAPAPHEDMVWIPGGEFAMGSDQHYPEEAPVHRVAVDGFWMDRCAVTNRDFARFVEDTGHATVAEREPDVADYPGAKPEFLVPFSAVFQMPSGPVDMRNAYNWWIHVPGANWRKPRGPGGPAALKRFPTHPVVHVAWDDVAAYAAWAGKQLPTEAEWEFAARGGLDGAEYAWGDDLTPDGVHMANTWQGEFPIQNLKEDGFAGTAPVESFPANGYGLFEVTGNVWEWTVDWYRDHGAAPASPCCAPPRNPAGGEREASYDPQLSDIHIPRRVIKGGSHLCAPNYCRRYRPAARMPHALDTSTSHLGFRCIVRPSAS